MTSPEDPQNQEPFNREDFRAVGVYPRLDSLLRRFWRRRLETDRCPPTRNIQSQCQTASFRPSDDTVNF